MNAILVFDPSNDLIFSKSNKQFRTRLLKYSRLQGLIAGEPAPSRLSSSSGSSSVSSLNSSGSSTSAASPAHTSARPSPSRRRRSHIRRRPDGRPYKEEDQLDTDKKYLEILMLLLTPYVASLRLNGHIKQQQRQQQAAFQPPPPPSPSPSPVSAGRDGSGSTASSSSDLLSKFMSSIQVNHECRKPPPFTKRSENEHIHHVDGLGGGRAEGPSPEEDAAAEEDEEPLEATRTASSRHHEFAPRRFSQFQMPVECLADCQIVYCELFDFIFIYMQQLDQVSGFKMRLLQKRIDLFARLALLLFGPSLNSMRNNGGGGGAVNQGHILRQCYDVWLEHQFEPQFLLEANERLMVGKSIEQHCRETLRKLSIHLRRCSGQRPADETQQHALLYSGTKLTYNIHHNNELAENDFGGGGGSSIKSPAKPAYCYGSNFDTDRRTSEIRQVSARCAPAAAAGAGSSPSAATNLTGRRRRRGRPTSGGQPAASAAQHQAASSSAARQLDDKLPSQFLIFLSTPGKFKDRLRVPHMMRLVPLARGVTLIIISEISTSYLSLQLNRVLKILLELTDPVAASAEANSARPASAKTPAELKDCYGLGAGDDGGGQVKLSQLAKINDCVCAIKSYFNGQNYDRIDHHHHHQRHPGEHPPSPPPSDSGSVSRGGAALASIGAGGQERQRRRRQQFHFPASLFGRLWSGSGSPNNNRAAQEESLEPEIGLDGSRRRSDFFSSSFSSIYESLDEHSRRQCCQLVCRLEDLVSSNMHTYMRRTFNLQVEGRKRQALLNSVAQVIRTSLDTFVFQPQMRLLNDLRGPYARLHAELIDQVRLIAGEHLSDYLDYLAVKATCNLTMGAPLTHDMLAIRSFIYVDRGRHEMLASPLRRSSSKMDRDSMLEVDFRSAISDSSRHLNLNKSLGESRHSLIGAEESTSSDSSSDDVSTSGEASDESSMTADSSSGSKESVIYRPSLSQQGPPATTTTTASKLLQLKKVAGGKRQAEAQSQWLIGTSGDLVTANELAGSSSGQSLNNSNIMPSKLSSSSGNLGGSGSAGREDYLNMTSSLIMDTQHHQGHLVDETLMKGFTCFIYNRLAKGKTSFTSNDVELDVERKLEISRQLEANYNSLPSVVCGDFFGSYTRSLFASKQADAAAGPATSRGSRRTSSGKLVEVACQLSELDARTGSRLVRRRLVKSMEEEPKEEDEEEEANSSSSDWHEDDSSENDFGLFLRNQVASSSSVAAASPRLKFTIERQNNQTRSPAAQIRGQPKKRAAPGQCFELFCVHQASLLVHRRQVLVEAERLARRLGFLCDGGDGDGDDNWYNK